MGNSAQDALRNGDLNGALAALKDAVRKDPADARLRIFLFQLFCVAGDWARAVAQAKLAAQMAPAAVPMAQAYREAIICEVYRAKVFAGDKVPMLFGAPKDWAAQLVQALKALAAGDHALAADLRRKAFDAAPAARGTLNGAPFTWLADADMRLGPLLEIVINGKYYWMPFTALREVTVAPPEDLRDAVWTPAQVVLASGGDVVAMIPTRYPGTVETGSDAEKLSRATRWENLGSETFAGVGQRLLATDTGDMPLMELRHLVVENGDG